MTESQIACNPLLWPIYMICEEKPIPLFNKYMVLPQIKKIKLLGIFSKVKTVNGAPLYLCWSKLCVFNHFNSYIHEFRQAT